MASVFPLITVKLQAQKEYDVVRNNWLQFSDAPNALYHHFARQAYSLLDKRIAAIKEIHSFTQEVYGLAKKEMTPVLLHAAAFDSTIKKAYQNKNAATQLRIIPDSTGKNVELYLDWIK